MTKSVPVTRPHLRIFLRAAVAAATLCGGFLEFAAAADGETDRTFRANLFESPDFDEIHAVSISKTGVIYTGGFRTKINGEGPFPGLLAFDKNGTRNKKFAPEIPQNAEVFDLAITLDDKLLVTSDQFVLRRLLKTGKRDNAFLESLVGAADYTSRIIALPDRRILLLNPGGDESVGHPYIMKLRVDGSIDPAFLTMSDGGGPNDITVDRQGRIWFAGPIASEELNYDVFGGRLESAGFPDASFPEDSFEYLTAYSITTLADGRILTGDGYCLTPNGELDPSWPQELFLEGDNPTVLKILQQADGKILLAGSFLVQVAGKKHYNLLRLNYDGSVDETFVGTTGPTGAINDMALQADGKIVIVGSFDEVNDLPQKCLARLTNNKGAAPSLVIAPSPGQKSGPSLQFLTGWYYVTSFAFRDGFAPNVSNCFIRLRAGIDSALVTEVRVPPFATTFRDPKVKEIGLLTTYGPSIVDINKAASNISVGNTQGFPALVWGPGTIFRTLVRDSKLMAFNAEGSLAVITNAVGGQHDLAGVQLVPKGPYKAIPGTSLAVGSNVGQMYSGVDPETPIPYDHCPRVIQFATAKKDGVMFYIGMFYISQEEEGETLTEEDAQSTDKTAPRLAFKFPRSGRTVYSDSTVIVGTGTDKGWIERVEWRVNGGDWNAANGQSDWGVTAFGLQLGKNTIEVRGVDAADNVGLPVKVSVVRK